MISIQNIKHCYNQHSKILYFSQGINRLNQLQDSATQHSITFVISQSACFQMWVKLVVGYQLRSHSHPIFMRREFPVHD